MPRNFFACCNGRHLRTDCEKHGSKNPLPFSVSERSHVGNLRQANKQGKGRSSKRKGTHLIRARRGKKGLAAYGQTVGVPSFLPTAVGTALSQPQVRQSPALRRAQLLAEFQRKTLRPLGTNTLAQFEYPAQPVLRNAARIGRTACAVRASQRVGAGIARVAVKPPQLHINYVCVTPTYTV